MLVATDGSPHAMRAATMAAQLARELRQAEVILVNVGSIPAMALGVPAAIGYVDPAPLEDAIEHHGHEVLKRTMETFAGTGVAVTQVYRIGDAAGEIVMAAREARADMIVIGARGLGQIGGLILGSVSERVLHAARCPVLVVR